MSRKHNVKHLRSKSHYPERLAARSASGADARMSDPKLADGKPASAKR